MKKNILKRILPFIALMLLLPWPIAYGYEAAGATAAGKQTQITAADVEKQPSWTAFGNAIGGVTPGDLFYINAANNPADINGTLYLTNAEELLPSYRYLILEVGIYVQTVNGDWDKITSINGDSFPETFITLNNGQAKLHLPGSGNYKITIEKGSFNCYGAETGNNISPHFYLEIS